MYKYTQNIRECEFCCRVFDDGENYWEDSRGNCYCCDNECGWEDDDED